MKNGKRLQFNVLSCRSFYLSVSNLKCKFMPLLFHYLHVYLAPEIVGFIGGALWHLHHEALRGAREVFGRKDIFRTGG